MNRPPVPTTLSIPSYNIEEVVQAKDLSALLRIKSVTRGIKGVKQG
jgi:hypothetical protein